MQFLCSILKNFEKLRNGLLYIDNFLKKFWLSPDIAEKEKTSWGEVQ
jgi:hypothetical protein